MRNLRHKSAYLNVPFFLGRTAFYFVVWVAFAVAAPRLVAGPGRDVDPSPSRRLQQLSGPGLVLLFLTGSFAAIDWGMSLEPRWASTIYGAMLVDRRGPVHPGADDRGRRHLASDRADDRGGHPGPAARPGQPAAGVRHALGLHGVLPVPDHLGGNLSEEIPWYLRRTHGGWQWVALVLIVFHFFLPFFVLLFRENKRQARLLLRVASLVLAMHWST